MASNGQVLPMVGNFIFVRLELPPGFLIKLNIKKLPAGRQAKAQSCLSDPNHSKAELMLLIAPMSSPAIGNTNVSGSFISHF